MAGSPHDGNSRSEQGTLIRFPRSKWVPDDGIEPLNGDVDAQHSSESSAIPELDAVQNGADERSSWPAFEASDFWASGDTQEFVGAASVGEDAEQDGPVAREAGHRQRLLHARLVTALWRRRCWLAGAWRRGVSLVPMPAASARRGFR